MNPSNKILIIIGMHRSGTSLCASWMHKCGLNIGNNLAGKAIGNTKGQFEDVDFLSLHNKVLKANNLYYEVSNQNINTSTFKNDFKNLIALKNKQPQWGWKEPRTCLFLNEYLKLLPESKNLIVYRHYNDVVDSLVRRFIKKEKVSTRKNKLAKYYNLYIKYNFFKKNVGNEWLKIWIRYNNEILNYIKQRNSNDYIITDLNGLIKNDSDIYNILTNNYGFKLNNISFSDVYDKSLLTTTRFSYKYSKKLIIEANRINSEFEKLKFSPC